MEVGGVVRETDSRMAEVPASVAESPGYFLPNKMGRIVLLALEEVMGKNSAVPIVPWWLF